MDKTIPPEIEKRMKEIISLLNNWNHEYYVLNRSIVSDEIYDQVLKELKNLEKVYNFVFFNSPTNKISQRDVKFFSVKHKIPMLSLESSGNYEELVRFDKRVKKMIGIDKVNYLCELKIDGLSASLNYQNGEIKKLVTRGDGFIGEDVSVNLHLIKNLPKNLPSEVTKETKIIEIRGEVYMKKEEFKRLNDELTKNQIPALANLRNAAAGTLRTLMPTQQRNLNFFAYQFMSHGSKISEIDNQSKCLRKLVEWKFDVSPYYRVCNNLEEIQNYYEEIQKERENLKFEIDGIVVKVNDYDYHKLMGETNRFPRWAFAYKFPSLSTISKIENICLEVTRSGRISYVAEIIPVFLQGSKINKVTLHNYNFIRNFNLNIGDQVVIEKAGDVIPQITQIIKLIDSKHYSWNFPSYCPSCNNELKWNSSETYQICFNEHCKEKIVNSLSFFASKIGMNIKGISKKNIEKLYQIGLLRTLGDFYQLKDKESDLLKMKNFKKKSVDNLLKAIENSKKQPFFNLITSLGIPLISSAKAKKIADICHDLRNFLQIINSKDLSFLGSSLGKETEKSIERYFQNKKNFEFLVNLEKMGSW